MLDNSQIYNLEDLKKLQQAGASVEQLRVAYKMIPENKKRKELATKELFLLLKDGKEILLGRVQKLIDRGADLNAQDANGVTPTMYAVMEGNMSVLEYFVREKKANINIQDKNGMVALMYALQKEDEKIINFLIESNPNLTLRDKNGWQPLMYSIDHASDNITRKLISKGADINARDYSGHSLLMMASLMGKESEVNLLIENGADIYACNNSNHTVLMYALDSCNEKIVDKIIETAFEADFSYFSNKRKFMDFINKQDENGLSAPMYAAKYGNIKALKIFLASKKMNLKITDANGKSMQEYVEEVKDAEIEKMLKEYKSESFEKIENIFQKRSLKASEIRSVDVDKKGEKVDHSLRRILFGGKQKGKNAPSKYLVSFARMKKEYQQYR